MTDAHSRLRALEARVTEAQSRFFGTLSFGLAYLTLTVLWVKFAGRFGLDNPGLTIYTFLVSVLAIYMANVVINTQNRQDRRDRERDDQEAGEVEEVDHLQRSQMVLFVAILALLVFLVARDLTRRRKR